MNAILSEKFNFPSHKKGDTEEHVLSTNDSLQNLQIPQILNLGVLYFFK